MAHEDRLAMYEFYQDEEGRSPDWADQKLCVLGASTELTAEVYRLAYPHMDSSAYSLEDRVKEAALIGDKSLEAALGEVGRQADRVINTDVTLREAIEAATAHCPSNLIGRSVVEEQVQLSIDLSFKVLAAASYGGGGPVWVPPDGTRRWFAPLEWSPDWSPEGAPDEPPVSLQATFEAMIEAMAREGRAGLEPFLASPTTGDPWGIASHTWYDPECSENVDEQSGCVAKFDKDGTSLEVVFIFTPLDGEWRLIESYVFE